MQEYGPDPETLGLLGRLHKDRYCEEKEKGSFLASAALDESISAYTRGFETDPRDYYPGINAITLLIAKGDEESLEMAEKLAPVVTFAVGRRGCISSDNYWDLATKLELYCIIKDWAPAENTLKKMLLYKAKEPWMIKSTLRNLKMLSQARIRQGHAVEELQKIIFHFETHINQLDELMPKSFKML